MSQLLPLFSENILPIFLIAGAGFLLGHFLEIDPRSVSRVIFYLFSPCLVFNLISQNHIPGGDVTRMVGLAAMVMLLNGLAAFGVGRLLRLERSLLAAVILVAMFSNAGNYGLSFNNFAFGETALTYASLYFVTSSMMVYTVGVVIASMGRADLKMAAKKLLTLPTLYALAAGILYKTMDWQVPLPLNRSINLLGQAAIPSMIVLLGLQLRRAVKTTHWQAIGLASSVKLLFSPMAAALLAAALNLHGPAWQAAISEAAMPSAVITIVLATEFDARPAFVTTAVTIITLLSPFTLTPLLALLV